MADDRRRCPLCGWDAETRRSSSTEAQEIACEHCGSFAITDALLATGLTVGDRKIFSYQSAHTRQETARGNRALLTTENWRDFARAHATTPVSRKLEKILDYVATRSEYPGDH